MESFRQEMELFFTLWGLLSKNFFFQNLSRLIQEIQNLHLSWLILTYLNLPWPILTNLDLWWPILTHFNLSWPILTHIELSWPILTSRNALQPFHYPACFVGFIPELSCIFFLSFNIAKLRLSPRLVLAGIDVRTFFSCNSSSRSPPVRACVRTSITRFEVSRLAC